ncbi:MAG: glycosyltransferase family 39 protein [Bacteroidia bacterium]|nr:glycosyltransferase family 39 protein [Bacteroidia bacterium]
MSNYFLGMGKIGFKAVLMFLLGMGILVVFHLTSFSGMKGFDGIEYARHAVEVLQGKLDLQDHHFAHRLAVVLPAASFYKILGVNDLASALPAMLATILIIFMMLNLAQRNHPNSGWWVILFFVLSPNILYYWDKLMPDIQVALGAMVAFWARAAYEKKSNPYLGIIMAMGLIWAFLAKATVILLAPIILFLLVKDLFQKKALKFWIWATSFTFGLLLIYFMTNYLLTGDPFIRIKRILAKGYLNTCSYDQLEPKFLIKRISYELIQIWAQNGSLIALMPCIPAYFFLRKKLDIHQRYWMEISLVGLLSANFMSISPTAYVPMCADERHFLFLIAPWAMGSGLVLGKLLNNSSASVGLAILALVLAIWIPGSPRIIFGIIAVASLLTLLKHKLHLLQYVVYLSILLALVLIPIEYGNYLRSLKYHAQRKALMEWMEKQKGNTLVVTDGVQERIGNYYIGFDSSYHIQFREFEVIEKSLLDKRPRPFLLMNAYSRFMSGMNWDDLPLFAREIPDQLTPMYKEDPSEMYEIPNMSWLQFPVSKWEDSVIYGYPKTENEQLDSAEVVLPKTFNKGWTLAFSDLPNKTGKYWIRAKLHIRNMDQGQANWQIHVDDLGGNNRQWESAELKHRTPVPGKWVKLQIDHMIEIPADTTQLIKMRVWNDGPALFEIAALKVSIAHIDNKKGQPN